MWNMILRHFSVLVDSFVSIASRPLLLLPTLFAAFATLLLASFYLDYINVFLVDFILYDAVADVSLLELPAYIASNYLFEFLALLFMLFIILSFNFYPIFVYSVFLEREAVKKSKGMIGSIAFNPSLSSKNNSVISDMIFVLRSFPKILSVAFFYFAFFCFFLLICVIALFSTILFPLISLLVLFVFPFFIIAFFYFLIVFVKAPIIMASTGEKLRLALSSSWSWCSGKVFQILVFLFFLFLAYGVLVFVFDSVAAFFQVEEIELLMGLFGAAFASSFFSFSLVKFFYSFTN